MYKISISKSRLRFSTTHQHHATTTCQRPGRQHFSSQSFSAQTIQPPNTPRSKFSALSRHDFIPPTEQFHTKSRPSTRRFSTATILFSALDHTIARDRPQRKCSQDRIRDSTSEPDRRPCGSCTYTQRGREASRLAKVISWNFIVAILGRTSRRLDARAGL